MGHLVIKTPIPLPEGVIDGTTVEVARCGDLWIPLGQNVNVTEQRSGPRRQGISISASGGDAEVIAGRYKTPVDANYQIPSIRSDLNMMKRDEIEVILRALVVQLGGKVTMDYHDLNGVSDRPIEVTYYQDPFMVKVELK